MDTPRPLRIHFGLNRPVLILFNNKHLGRLCRFQLHASCEEPLVKTTYEVGGCYPDWENPPDDGMSNKAYPLRMAFSHNINDSVITYKGRPIDFVKDILLVFEADAEPPRYCKKPTIRMTIYEHKNFDELIEELLDLGVEVITEPTPATLKMRVLGADPS